MKLTADYIGKQFLRTVPTIEMVLGEDGKPVEAKNYSLMKMPICLKNITPSHFLMVATFAGNARHILPTDLYDDENWMLYDDLDEDFAKQELEKELENTPKELAPVE